MLCPKAVVGTVNKKKVKKDYSNNWNWILAIIQKRSKRNFFIYGSSDEK